MFPIIVICIVCINKLLHYFTSLICVSSQPLKPLHMSFVFFTSSFWKPSKNQRGIHFYWFIQTNKREQITSCFRDHLRAFLCMVLLMKLSFLFHACGLRMLCVTTVLQTYRFLKWSKFWLLDFFFLIENVWLIVLKLVVLFKFNLKALG